jgi:hypothetical protein
MIWRGASRNLSYLQLLRNHVSVKALGGCHNVEEFVAQSWMRLILQMFDVAEEVG